MRRFVGVSRTPGSNRASPLRSLAAAACLLVLLVLLPRAARADEVVLANGDRLTGRVMRKAGDQIFVQTAYSPPLMLNWKAVRSLRIDQLIPITFRGRPTVLTRLQPTDEPGRVDAGPDIGVVALSEIDFINPTAEEAGIGMRYQARLALGLTESSGNSRDSRAFGNGELTARARPWRWTVAGRFAHAANADAGTELNWLVNANYDRFLEPTRFLYARTSLEHDPFKDLSRRSTFGLGYGRQFRETEHLNLSIRWGVEWVSLHRVSGDVQGFPALGWGVNLLYRPWPGGVELFLQQEGFHSTRAQGDVTVHTRTGMRLPLAAGVSANVQLNWDWEGRPAEGRRPSDRSLQVGLGFAW